MNATLTATALHIYTTKPFTACKACETMLPIQQSWYTEYNRPDLPTNTNTTPACSVQCLVQCLPESSKRCCMSQCRSFTALARPMHPTSSRGSMQLAWHAYAQDACVTEAYTCIWGMPCRGLLPAVVAAHMHTPARLSDWHHTRHVKVYGAPCKCL